MAKTVADPKKNLRAILKEARASLAASYVATASGEVQGRLLGWQHWHAAEAVVLYSGHDNEVSTEAILDEALGSGRAIYFPRLRQVSADLLLVRVRARSELCPGAFAILEPSGNELVAPGQLSHALVCVPGLAFTPRGDRLGRGGGHFDRLLSQLGPDAVTVGLAYSFQLLDSLPVASHDRRLNFVITEHGLYGECAAPRTRRGHECQGGKGKWLPF